MSQTVQVQSPRAESQASGGRRTSARLVLENGVQFWGTAIGASGIAVGELVFNTSPTGYQEILMAPSYAQQVVTPPYLHLELDW